MAEPIEVAPSSSLTDLRLEIDDFSEPLIPTAANSPVKSEPSGSIVIPNLQREDSRSEFDLIMDQLDKTPKSPELWRRAVDLAEAEGETDKIERVYLALLRVYPQTPAAQIAYIDHFLQDPKTFSKAEDLFRNYLRNSPSVELCRFYLNYVRRVNAQPGLRDSVRMSFDFALNHIGQDKDSGDIWADYIQFLNSDSSSTAPGASATTSTTWEAQQRMDSLRKVYHRAVQIPLENVQKLWEELESFETNLNKITAKKFLSDLSPPHVQARQVLRELKTHYSALGLSSSASLPAGSRPPLYLPSVPTFSASERALLGNWKKYLKWEEANPLELEIEDKDRTVYIQRVMGVYRKALSRMRFWAEIWFMAYSFLTSVSKHDDACAIIKSGIEALPNSFLLNLTLCEILEKKAMADSRVPRDFAPVYGAYDRFLTVIRTALQDAESGEEASLFQASAPGDSQMTEDLSGSQEKRSSPEKSAQYPSHSDIRREFSLLYIMLMRFAHRAEGQKGSRAVFARARKEGTVIPKKEGDESKITRKKGAVGWEVYEAAALLEYHTAEDKAIPARLFEKGMEFFGDDVSYVERHLGYLITVNDEKNARALFERVISDPSFPPEKARPLWQRWAKYEYHYGTLEATLKLEQRMEEAYPKEPPIKRFAQRHTYLDIDAIASVDLGARYLPPATNGLSPFSSTSSILPQSSFTLPQKRPSSPEVRGKEKEREGGNKRQRGMSPLPPRDRDRDVRDRPTERARDGRWDGSRRKFSPPPPSSSWDKEKRKEEETPPKVILPAVLKEFIGHLPNPTVFDGPIFRTDDLISLFRNAVIPSATPRSRSPPPAQPPPPPPRSGGRPPPDYGPYQGPGGGTRSRRY